MANVQYAAPVTALRGSVGGWTFQRNRSGYIVRLRSGGRQSPTAAQSASIASHNQLISAYNELIPSFKQDWDDFALAHTHEDRFGNTKTLTGQNWYVSINRNRLLCGEGILNAPPSYLLPDGNSDFSMTIDISQILFTKSAPISPTDTALKIFTTPPIERRTTSLESDLRLTRVLTTPPFNPVNLIVQWGIVHNCEWPPSSSYNYFTIGVMLQLVRISTGISQAGNTQLYELVDPPIGIGYWIIETDFKIW